MGWDNKAFYLPKQRSFNNNWDKEEKNRQKIIFPLRV
jgi:hypothetical protein